jgi:hypothetical protein
MGASNGGLPQYVLLACPIPAVNCSGVPTRSFLAMEGMGLVLAASASVLPVSAAEHKMAAAIPANFLVLKEELNSWFSWPINGFMNDNYIINYIYLPIC